MHEGSPFFTGVLKIHHVLGVIMPFWIDRLGRKFQLRRIGEDWWYRELDYQYDRAEIWVKGFPPDWLEEAATQLDLLHKGVQGG